MIRFSVVHSLFVVVRFSVVHGLFVVVRFSVVHGLFVVSGLAPRWAAEQPQNCHRDLPEEMRCS